jgi:hypothetical protein
VPPRIAGKSNLGNHVTLRGKTLSAVASALPLQILLFGAGIFLLAMPSLPARLAFARQYPHNTPSQTKIAEGEYAIHERHNGGAVGPFEEEVFGFRESWTLWRVASGEYRVEGVRRFESPKDESHANRFTIDLTRDLTMTRAKEFAKLKWVRDSGPLSCNFLPAELQCSAGGSDPKHEIKLRTPLNKPYALLWPVSPFSFGGITREVERDKTHATQVDFVRIEQPGSANPVRATILEGPLQYVGVQEIQAAGRTWRAEKFSLKIPFHPQILIWTSHKGLLLSLAFEHEYKDWPDEGLKLERFEGSSEF